MRERSIARDRRETNSGSGAVCSGGAGGTSATTRSRMPHIKCATTASTKIPRGKISMSVPLAATVAAPTIAQVRLYRLVRRASSSAAAPSQTRLSRAGHCAAHKVV